MEKDSGVTKTQKALENTGRNKFLSCKFYASKPFETISLFVLSQAEKDAVNVLCRLTHTNAM